MGPGELLVMIGPPAVGKMTVGRALCARTAGTGHEWRLFHNHHTIEPLLEIFGYGTPPFAVLNREFRRRVIEEAAASDVRLVFTLMWEVDVPGDAAAVRHLIAPYVDRELPVSFVELYADLPTRLGRNRGADRIDAKPSKRDLDWSHAQVRGAESSRMNTSPTEPSVADDLLAGHHHLRLDNTDATAEQTAARILQWLARRG
jgi:hypothetical protein